MTENYEELPLQGLGSLQRAFSSLSQPLELVGLHSPLSLALLLLQTDTAYSKNPQLAVFATEKESEKFHESLELFSPTTKAIHLPAFDVGVYSGLYPNQKMIAGRLRWLHRAGKAKPGEVFTATQESLCQLTLPFDVFNSKSFNINKGEDLPSDLHEILEKMGYQSVPTVEDYGSFAIRGGILDIYSPAHQNPIRVELFGEYHRKYPRFSMRNHREVWKIVNILALSRPKKPSIEIVIFKKLPKISAKVVKDESSPRKKYKKY